MPGPVLAWTSSKNHFIISSLPLCGGQDNEISVFKAGRQCEAGLEMLKAAAAEEEQEFEKDPYEEEHLLADSENEDNEIIEQDDGNISDD